MTDEEIFVKYVKEQSKLIQKYELKGDLETYQQKLEKLKEKYKGTIVEKLDKEYLEGDSREEEIEDEEAAVQPLSKEEIFEIKDPNEFIMQYRMFLEQKCDYGKNKETLSLVEKVVYDVDTLNTEVHSAGFEGYLSGDDFPGAEELEECLIEIKAIEVLEIWKKVKKIFPDNCIPESAEKRSAIVEKKRRTLERLDSKFYDYPEDLETLLFEYVKSCERRK